MLKFVQILSHILMVVGCSYIKDEVLKQSKYCINFEMKKNLMLKANTKSINEHHSRCSLTPPDQGSGQVLFKALKCAHLSSHLRPSSQVAAGLPVVIL